MKKSTPKIRVTVDLNEQLYARLEALEAITDADSKADVIRDSIRLYEYFVNLAQAGAKFSVTKDGTTETVVLFGLPAPETQPASSIQLKSFNAP